MTPRRGLLALVCSLLIGGALLPGSAALAAPIGSPVTVSANAAGATAWRTTEPVLVTASGASLFSVRLVPVTGGPSIGGSVSPDRSRWRSTVELTPSTTYRLAVSVSLPAPPAPPAPSSPMPEPLPVPDPPAVPAPTSPSPTGPSQEPVIVPPSESLAPAAAPPVVTTSPPPAPAMSVQALVATLRTAAPLRSVKAFVPNPIAGSVVGVGMPVVVRFTAPVTDRAAVVRRLQIITSKPTGPGAWHWRSPTEVHYRPQAYWPAYTKITVSAALRGVRVAPGTWGTEGRALTFTTGRGQVLRVDAARHTMTVVVDGKLLRTLPVSVGKRGFETRSGVKIIGARYPSLRMRSSSIGIPAGSRESYDLTVPYAMALTTSGEFLHGAPWNTAIGRANTSHGCTNLRLDDARWLFSRVLPGDPVETIGTIRSMEPAGNGLSSDWNLSWAAWSAP